MYQTMLFDEYKKAQNYTQDQQLAQDLDLPPSRISEMRRGKGALKEQAIVFLAHGAGISPELALLRHKIDQSNDPALKFLWLSITRKFQDQM